MHMNKSLITSKPPIFPISIPLQLLVHHEHNIQYKQVPASVTQKALFGNLGLKYHPIKQSCLQRYSITVKERYISSKRLLSIYKPLSLPETGIFDHGHAMQVNQHLWHIYH